MNDAVTGRERQLAHALHRRIEQSGGFTVHRHSHRPVHRGVSVGADPSATLRVPWPKWDHEVIAEWIHRHADRRDHDDLHLGGWLDPLGGEACLDLVHVYPESARREALLTGLRHQEHSVFDIGARSLVCLVGLTATSIDTVALAVLFGVTG